MSSSTYRNSNDNIDPDFSNNLFYRIKSEMDAVRESKAISLISGVTHLSLINPILHQCSSFSLPIIHPAVMAIRSPVSTYIRAVFQPNKPNSKITATSLIIGAAIRNEKVTPNGTPDSTNPRNNGMAEHEQKE